jgi:hypothetical protein
MITFVFLLTEFETSYWCLGILDVPRYNVQNENTDPHTTKESQRAERYCRMIYQQNISIP